MKNYTVISSANINASHDVVYLNDKTYKTEKNAVAALRMMQGNDDNLHVIVFDDNTAKLANITVKQQQEDNSEQQPQQYVVYINPYLGAKLMKHKMPVIKNPKLKAKKIPQSQRNVVNKRSNNGIASPVKLVHSICAQLHKQNANVTRKDMVSACEQAGIATNTARTQVQKYRALHGMNKQQ